MRTFALFCAFFVAALGIVACGGGGGYTAPAVTTPTASPPANTGATTLSMATLLGSPGFQAPSGLTVYQLAGDSTTSLLCTVASGCTQAWPPIAPPAGVTLSTNFTTFVRADNNAMQLAYKGHPLYTFAGDSASGQTNGNNLTEFGGLWTVERP
jgi:predicted lipoprotein with Yx(FWY)xxD motif